LSLAFIAAMCNGDVKDENSFIKVAATMGRRFWNPCRSSWVINRDDKPNIYNRIYSKGVTVIDGDDDLVGIIPVLYTFRIDSNLCYSVLMGGVLF
jgi:hypothetical protein